mgnify:CR=1 FL=1
MRYITSRARALTAALLLAATLPALVGFAPAAGAASAPKDGPDSAFYHYSGTTPLSAIAPGTVLKTRTFTYWGLLWPVTVDQLLYRSTDALDRPTVNVASVNDAPALVLTGGTLATVGQQFTFTASATDADAAVLGLNAVSDGEHVIVSPRATDLAGELRDRGLTPVPVDTSELLKGGGSVKCWSARMSVSGTTSPWLRAGRRRLASSSSSLLRLSRPSSYTARKPGSTTVVPVARKLASATGKLTDTVSSVAWIIWQATVRFQISS